MTSEPREVVRVERDGDVLVVIIDNPPVNASSAAVRQGLLDAFTAADADGSLRGVVVIGAGRNLMAGADINEHGGPLAEPSLPAVFDLIEACRVPVVAAVHGAALGGGCELALACDARVAAPGAVIGLPEVSLGIIPGAGGTVRLPRLVGVVTALDLIGHATRLSATEASGLGLVDEVASGDLRAAAVARAGTMEGKRRLRDLDVPAFDADELATVEAAVLRSAGDRPHVRAAIAAVRRTTTVPVDDALAAERSAFDELRVSEEAGALRHLFFAERHADQAARRAAAGGRPVDRAVVVGAGTMGASIAWALAVAGLEVVLTDTDADTAQQGRDRVAASAGRRLPKEQLDAVLARLTAAGGVEAAADADLVVEAVFEDMAVKQDVFRRLDAVVRPGAVLATNTSYLDVDAIAAATGRPSDVVGMHFFAPAHVMRLLEVVRGAESSDAAVDTALAVGGRLGKVPVVARVGDGFIGNRIFGAYRRQHDLMMEEGAYPEDLDAAMRGFGFAMGPYQVNDLSGLDISYRNRQRLAATRDARERYVHIADRLVEAGRLGQKTGAGWYRYDDGRTPVSDPLVRDVVDAASAEKGVARRAFTAAEIVERSMVAMVNEAAHVLQDGVASSPDDIDLVLVHGFAFPRHRGGPLWWAARQDAVGLAAALDRTAEASGFGFTKVDLPAFLDTLH